MRIENWLMFDTQSTIIGHYRLTPRISLKVLKKNKELWPCPCHAVRVAGWPTAACSCMPDAEESRQPSDCGEERMKEIDRSGISTCLRLTTSVLPQSSWKKNELQAEM